MLWTTCTYVVENMFMNVVHNIYMFSTTYDMLWSTFAVFHCVPHNIHPQHIMFSTTYTHNICSFICCGYMLWRTTPICCGVHMLWSATTFTDEGYKSYVCTPMSVILCLWFKCVILIPLSLTHSPDHCCVTGTRFESRCRRKK